MQLTIQQSLVVQQLIEKVIESSKMFLLSCI